MQPHIRQLQVYLISPAAIKIGSLLSWLVMLSTENWEMLSQLLVWISGSLRRRKKKTDQLSEDNDNHKFVKDVLIITLSEYLHL